MFHVERLARRDEFVVVAMLRVRLRISEWRAQCVKVFHVEPGDGVRLVKAMLGGAFVFEN